MFALTAIHPSRFRRLAKEGSWIVTGQIAVAAGALVLVRVLAEYLTPAQYGQLALGLTGLTVAGLVDKIVTGGISAGIGRFYFIAAEKQDLGGYLSHPITHNSPRILQPLDEGPHDDALRH